MLRHRQSMKTKPDLSHRKSTSSARSVILEHLDPALAQRDAHIAAHQAFAKGQDRSSAEMALFPPPKSASPLRQLHPQEESTGKDSAEARTGAVEKPGIPRRQSVRFVGPCTVQNRGLSDRGQRPQTPGSVVPGAVDPANILETGNGTSLTHKPTTTLNQPHARPGTSASTQSSKIVGNYLHAMAAQDDRYTPEDDVASVPSSYRHLRRSQSLHPSRSPGQARDSADSYLVPGSGATRQIRTSMSMRTLDPNRGKENVPPLKVPTLKAPKSMSFLKGRRGRISSVTSHDSAAATPMDADSTQMPLRTKTSSFFGSRSRRVESGLRSTLRDGSSQAEIVHTPASVVLPLPKDGKGSLRNKARKASKTLKNKFLNLFGSNKGDDEMLFPEQHVKSQRQHIANELGSFDSGAGGPSHSENCDANYNHCNLSQVVSAACGQREFSLGTFDGQDRGQDSNEETVPDDKSRVTSWTNSGPSTLTSEQQLAWKEWEKQRLSIIKENGAHCPSPSMQRQAIGEHIFKSQESLTGRPIPPGPTVDSQRVYAALMERLAETTQLAQVVEQQRKSLAEDTKSHRPVSSDFEEYEDNGAKPAPLTVRRATSKESLTEHARWLSPPVTLIPQIGNHGVADARGISSSERTNAFFGSPEAHLFRTESPYRRALRRSVEEAEDEMRGRRGTEARVVSDCGTEIRRPEEATFYEDAYSESVYSSDEQAVCRATDTMQSLSEAVEGPSSSAGNMSMSVDPPVTYRPTGHRAVSSVSSIDWKTWLSANIARLEPSPSPTRLSEASPTRRSNVEVATPRMPFSSRHGHVREAAQIDSDNELEPLRLDPPATHQPTLPTSLTSTSSETAKISVMHRSVAMTAPPPEKFLTGTGNTKPLSELRSYLDNDPLPSPELPPPIPARSPLRMNPYIGLSNAKSMKDLSDEGSSNSQRVDEGRSLAHICSLNRLREMNSNPDSPETPTPNPTRLQKKRSGFLYTPSVVASETATSPGLTAAVEKQFGAVSKPNTGKGENKENEGAGDPYGLGRSGMLGSIPSGSEQRSAKTKRMVDVFLSSRRKRFASGSDDSPAFL